MITEFITQDLLKSEKSAHTNSAKTIGTNWNTWLHLTISVSLQNLLTNGQEYTVLQQSLHFCVHQLTSKEPFVYLARHAHTHCSCY